MVDPKKIPQLPFKIIYSFKKLIEELEQSEYYIGEFKVFLEYLRSEMPEFIDGVDSIQAFEKLADNIAPLIDKIIPKPLMKNNLKAIGFPLSEKYFYPTDALKEIIDNENTVVHAKFISVDFDDIYKICCCLILNRYYNINLEFNQNNLLEIDNGKGYNTFLSVSYNFEYFDLYPSNPSFELSQDQIEELLNNYENTELWMTYFPIDSWVGNGFMVASFFDNTTFIALSNLKTKLLSYNDGMEQINEDTISSLKSIFRLNDLKVGFSSYNSDQEKIEDFPLRIPSESLILNNNSALKINEIFCTNLLDKINNSDYYVISNVEKFQEKYPEDQLVKILLKEGIKSFILYPLKRGKECLGILEIGSSQAGVFNRINAYQLRELLPLIEDSIYRYTVDLEHQINSFIQTEYTSLHPSVDWKFKNKAREIILNPNSTKKKTQISFKDVYPFYGEVDVRNSSALRNQCLKEDYQNQLNFLIKVCQELYNRTGKDKFLDYIEQLASFLNRIDNVQKVYFEQEIFEYIAMYIHPEIPKYIQEDDHSIVAEYLKKLDNFTGLFYVERKKFDESILMLNKLLSSKLDLFQRDAQNIFPHYYERFKTDGIDYNLYVGRSISPNKDFSYAKIRAIRFWQLQAMIALDQNARALKNEMPVHLDVASLILATNNPLDIQFKLDEKRFDIDGYNNAKYEIIKKRINKAFVKDSNERINIPGKLCVIYSEEILKEEYSNYFALLIDKQYLKNDIEFLEVEELQGLGGLLALRVSINYDERVTYCSTLE
ncbi:hypothetical protein [Faecalibacter rhinopitheci]|uniref:GAF domain-containing protein n=1 Tax=Faecalibacter rhinopitheci TaxID=2779678 RepID=A0A8J7K9J6_9FLAO|nr:hypothetical protein [Faecalibacter rhinopitheci]MBF0596230.1 hypothetical protein [Faecalibacter rhinopitheci]